MPDKEEKPGAPGEEAPGTASGKSGPARSKAGSAGSGSTSSAGPGASSQAGAGEEQHKRGLEEKLDDFAEKFSKAMGDGVKRMENAFEKGFRDIRDNPSFSKSRVRGFFTSSTGGSILVVIGFVWLFYAVGLLDQPIFPALLIILGFYLMHKYKSDDGD